MATNGHNYELTLKLEEWKNEDLIKYVLDTEAIMGLEKYQIAKFAQELASRFEPYGIGEDEYFDRYDGESDNNDGSGEFND
jgi:hypothetical protein